MAALAKESIDVWENFAEVTGLEGYEIDLHHGGYMFCTLEERMVAAVKETVAGYHAVGVTDSEFLTGDEVIKRYPWISPEVKAAAFRAKDGWFSAHEVTQGFARASEKARFFVRTRATGIERDEKGVFRGRHRSGPDQDPRRGQCRGPVRPSPSQDGLASNCPFTRCGASGFLWPRTPKIPKDAPLTIDLENESYWRPETGGAPPGLARSRRAKVGAPGRPLRATGIFRPSPWKWSPA